jgi:hypothetical protein
VTLFGDGELAAVYNHRKILASIFFCYRRSQDRRRMKLVTLLLAMPFNPGAIQLILTSVAFVTPLLPFWFVSDRELLEFPIGLV